jgi:hypothetical protein
MYTTEMDVCAVFFMSHLEIFPGRTKYRFWASRSGFWMLTDRRHIGADPVVRDAFSISSSDTAFMSLFRHHNQTLGKHKCCLRDPVSPLIAFEIT